MEYIVTSQYTCRYVALVHLHTYYTRDIKKHGTRNSDTQLDASQPLYE